MEIHPVLSPDRFYHIYNRGNNRDLLFLEEKNYPFFLKLYSKYISPVASTFAFNLLKNHFHFLIKIKKEQDLHQVQKKSNRKKLYPVEKFVSLCFSDFFNAYAKSLNATYERTGSLFQERFRRKEIEHPAYLPESTFYIHANSQKHRITRDFHTYPHSSYLAHLLPNGTTFLNNEVLEWFGGRSKYIEYHLDYRNPLIEKSIFLENFLDD